MYATHKIKYNGSTNMSQVKCYFPQLVVLWRNGRLLHKITCYWLHVYFVLIKKHSWIFHLKITPLLHKLKTYININRINNHLTSNKITTQTLYLKSCSNLSLPSWLSTRWETFFPKTQNINILHTNQNSQFAN